MMSSFTHSLFAAVDISTIFTIAIFVISIIAWLVNMANERNQQNPRNPAPKPRPRQHDDRFQNEIDMFLNEVQGKNQPQEVPIEIVPDDEIRDRGLQGAAAGSLANESLRDRHLESSIGTHVNQYMHSDGIDASVVGELGSLSDRASRKRETPQKKPAPAAANVVKWLNNPEDVRKAIIVGEILAPCRSLPAKQ